MPGAPAISIITPTFGREPLLRMQHQVVLAQTEQNFEWLILDDSAEPSAYFLAISDPRIRYAHVGAQRLTIGTKRNWLVDQAQSEVIAHFDDDDYYAPNYLAVMRERLQRGADMVKLSAWFVYTTRVAKVGYWDTVLTRGLHFRFSNEPIKPVMLSEANAKAFETHYAGFGFSYVYRKALWRKAPFPSQNMNEDYQFVSAALAAGFGLHHFADERGLCLHVLREDNTAACYPQYVLPDFLLTQLFGPALTQHLASQGAAG